MQLTASKPYPAGWWARAAQALSRCADAPARRAPLAQNRPVANEAATLSRRIVRPTAAPWAVRRSHGAVALTISAGLHLALLAAWSAVSQAPATHGPGLESQVVHVRLAAAANSGGANLDPVEPRARIVASPAPIPKRVDRSPAALPMTQAGAQAVVRAGASEQPASPPPSASSAVAASAGPATTAEPERAAAAAPPPAAVAETPAYLHAPEPEYPQSAREDEQEGLVVLRVLVSRDGLPAEIRIAKSSGFRALDAAATAGVKRWKFSPARRDQRAIDSWMDVPIRFRLQ